MKTNKYLLYRGALYVEAADQYDIPELPSKELYTHEEVTSRGGVEAGDALAPDGELYIGWADLGGWKYAEIEGGYLRIDQKPEWMWTWDKDVTQDNLIEFMWNEKFRKQAR